MKQRGRTSAVALATPVRIDASQADRSDAPYDLTDRQAEEWWAVVNRMPADWFPRETHGLLAQYCRLVVSISHVSQLVNAVEKQELRGLDLGEYQKLLKLQMDQGKLLAHLATKMRITQQSTYDKSKKNTVSAKKPWDN